MGRYGRGKQVVIGTVYGALLAVGKTVSLVYEGNLTKEKGDKYLVPRMAQNMEGWRKEEPTTKKKLLMRIDVLEFLSDLSMAKDSTEVVK